MYLKHSQTECLLKNPLICWNMFHMVMLMWRIESLKQNGLSLSKSLQFHLEMVWIRIFEPCEKNRGFFLSSPLQQMYELSPLLS